MPKRAYSNEDYTNREKQKKQYQMLFKPLPVQSNEVLYFDKEAVSLPYAEDFPRLHYHDRYEIGVCESGEGLFLSEGEYFSVSKGDLIFIPVESRHYSRSLRAESPCRCRFIYLRAQELEGLVHDCSREDIGKIPAVIRPSRYPQAAALISEITEACKHNYPNKERLVALRAALLVLEAERWFSESERATDFEAQKCAVCENDEVVLRVAEFLALNYNGSHSMRDLASSCFISESQLRRRFCAEYGMPPIAYRNRLRCNIASELLIKTSLSVYDISERVGYSAVSDFYRIFKKNFGVSPSEYRKTRVNN